MGATAIVAAAAAMTACAKKSPTQPVACTQVAVPAITVTVVDSATGAPKLFTGLWARAKEGSYSDSVALNLGDKLKGNVVMSLAYEHVGTLDVTVHADGYLNWELDRVAVNGDGCHPITANLTARLAH